MTRHNTGAPSGVTQATRVQQGGIAETLACRYLEARGLELVSRNYRCRLGELDLIMRDGRHLVFIEVRSRGHGRYGHPAETVTRTKQQRLLRTAAHYLQRHDWKMPCRFDVVAITARGDAPELEWIKDAFQAD
jgi:putative endonuclease